MKQIIQDVRSGVTSVKEIPDPIALPGQVLIAEMVSAISAGTERYVVDLAKKSLIGKAPEKSPACVPALEDIIVDAGVHAGDFRNSGGALWIYTEDKTSGLARQLRSMGFALRQGRGWYKE